MLCKPNTVALPVGNTVKPYDRSHQFAPEKKKVCLRVSHWSKIEKCARHRRHSRKLGNARLGAKGTLREMQEYMETLGIQKLMTVFLVLNYANKSVRELVGPDVS